MISTYLFWFIVGGASAVWFLGSLVFWLGLCATMRDVRREKREPITKAITLNPRLVFTAETQRRGGAR